jgi:hypothetical protein
MKFAKVDTPWKTKTAVLTNLLGSESLDCLQLDLHWPTEWHGNTSEADLDKALASEFLSHMNVIHKWLFLRPEFCLITNAGGLHVVKRMEGLARFLVEHGSDELPIAAVKGTNLLATIDHWLPVEIANSGRKVLAAQVEIGGGPLALAIADGARMVVTGSYDRASPRLAAAVASGLVSWHDYDALAALAITSHQNGSSIECHDGSVEVTEQFIAPNELQFADVYIDGSRLVLNDTPRGTWQVSGVGGKAGDSNWNLQVTLDAGFRAAVLIEGEAESIRDFCGNSFPESAVFVEQWVRVDCKELSLSRVRLDGETFLQCSERLELLESWAVETGRNLFEPAASIARLTESRDIRIPADQVILSVDTRPAREWL